MMHIRHKNVTLIVFMLRMSTLVKKLFASVFLPLVLGTSTSLGLQKKVIFKDF